MISEAVQLAMIAVIPVLVTAMSTIYIQSQAQQREVLAQQREVRASLKADEQIKATEEVKHLVNGTQTNLDEKVETLKNHITDLKVEAATKTAKKVR